MTRFGFSLQLDCGKCQGLDNEENFREFIALIIAETKAQVIGETFTKSLGRNKIYLVPLDFGFIHMRAFGEDLYIDVLHKNKYNPVDIIKGLSKFAPKTIVPNLDIRATNDIPVEGKTPEGQPTILSKNRPWRQMVVKKDQNEGYN